MSPAVRGVVAVILGLLLAFAIAFAVDAVNAKIYPPRPASTSPIPSRSRR